MCQYLFPYFFLLQADFKACFILRQRNIMNFVLLKNISCYLHFFGSRQGFEFCTCSAFLENIFTLFPKKVPQEDDAAPS